MDVRAWNERARTATFPVVAIGSFLAVVLVLWVVTPICTVGSIRLPAVTEADFLIGRRAVCRVRLYSNGSITFQGRPVAVAGLPHLFNASRAVHEDLRVLVSADRAVPYSSIRPVLAAAQRAGLRSVTLEVESPRLVRARF